MSKPKVIGGKADQAGHLRRYVKEDDHEEESGQAANKVTVRAAIPLESRITINYILGGLSDDQYLSKRQQKKILMVATIKARINAIHTKGSHEETKPIDDPISFPPINSNMIIMPHYDALVFTLCINNFDVHRVLVDLRNAIDVKLPTKTQCTFHRC